MSLNNKIRHGIIAFKTFCFRVLLWLRTHRELVTYGIVGGLTTAVDWSISFLLYRTDMNTHAVNVIAWTAAVLFAFAANKKWVFRSRTRAAARVTGELIAFAGGRVLSLGVQELLFLLTVDVLAWRPTYVKIPVAVLVVIINYFLTKFVFRKKQDEASPEERSAPRPTAYAKGRSVVIGGESEDTLTQSDTSELPAPDAGDPIQQTEGDIQ